MYNASHHLSAVSRYIVTITNKVSSVEMNQLQVMESCAVESQWTQSNQVNGNL